VRLVLELKKTSCCCRIFSHRLILVNLDIIESDSISLNNRCESYIHDRLLQIELYHCIPWIIRAVAGLPIEASPIDLFEKCIFYQDSSTI